MLLERYEDPAVDQENLWKLVVNMRNKSPCQTLDTWRQGQRYHSVVNKKLSAWVL